MGAAPQQIGARAGATLPSTPVQQWVVRGAFRDSAKDASLTITAATQAAAEYEAAQHGLLVESCWPATHGGSPLTAPPVPPQPIPYARPFGPPGMPFVPPAPRVLIERTSKRFKWQMLAALLLMLFGLFSGCLFAPLAGAAWPELGVLVLMCGVACFIGGSVWGIVAKMCAWWHHG